MSSTDRPVIAHLLRHTGFGPFPGQVDAMAAAGNVDAAITSVLGATPPALGPSPKLNDGDPGDDPQQWWLRRMRVPGVGCLVIPYSVYTRFLMACGTLRTVRV